uniref:DUF1725 domain-containing protein n=1 Tax=Felis catus TaxID=9685 RepID=A0ABI7Z2N5_FELCA
IRLTIAKLWRKPKCPSTGEWIKKMWCVHTHIHEYYSAIKKNEVLPFATTWIELKCIMLSESEKDKYHMISFMTSLMTSLTHSHVEFKKQNR